MSLPSPHPHAPTPRVDPPMAPIYAWGHHIWWQQSAWRRWRRWRRTRLLRLRFIDIHAKDAADVDPLGVPLIPRSARLALVVERGRCSMASLMASLHRPFMDRSFPLLPLHRKLGEILVVALLLFHVVTHKQMLALVLLVLVLHIMHGPFASHGRAIHALPPPHMHCLPDRIPNTAVMGYRGRRQAHAGVSVCIRSCMQSCVPPDYLRVGDPLNHPLNHPLNPYSLASEGSGIEDTFQGCNLCWCTTPNTTPNDRSESGLEAIVLAALVALAALAALIPARAHHPTEYGPSSHTFAGHQQVVAI